jgi:hypothetical protein
MEARRQAVSMVEGEEGGRRRSSTVERKDGGRPDAVESAVVEHAVALRVWQLVAMQWSRGK